MIFDVISIDYAWNFKVHNKKTGRGRSAAKHYDTDSLTWDDWKFFIQHLWGLMARNCALPLWMVRPSQNRATLHVDVFWNQWIEQRYPFRLPDGSPRAETEVGTPLPAPMHRLEYKTELFTLVKKYRSGKPSINGGFYTRANTEPCNLWVRGDMPREDAGVPQVIDFVPHDIPKHIRHSYKPAEYRRRIERLWPGRRYLEIFSRPDTITSEDDQWTFIGNEIDGKDVRIALRDLAAL